MKKKKALVLITVLWIMVILTTLSLGLYRRIYLQLKSIKNKQELVKTRLALQSALNFVVATVSSDDDHENDSKQDAFYDNKDLFMKHSFMPGYTFSVKTFEDGEDEDIPLVRYGIDPSNSKLNLNYLTKEQETLIFEDFPFDKAVLSAVLDWIDTDNDPYNHGDGAESDYYEDLSIPFKIKNAPIETFDELTLVKDMKPEILNYLKKHFSILGNDNKINIHYANPMALKWMGFSEIFIDKLDRFFKGIDEEYGTEDDQSFKDLNTMINDLNDFEQLYQDEVSLIQKNMPYITLSSNYFFVIIDANIQQKYAPLKLTASIERKDESIQVLRVQEIIA